MGCPWTRRQNALRTYKNRHLSVTSGRFFLIIKIIPGSLVEIFFFISRNFKRVV